jgi:hypothetical protein
MITITKCPICNSSLVKNECKNEDKYDRYHIFKQGSAIILNLEKLEIRFNTYYCKVEAYLHEDCDRSFLLFKEKYSHLDWNGEDIFTNQNDLTDKIVLYYFNKAKLLLAFA